MDELPDLSADEGDGPELGSPSDESEVERRPGEVLDPLEKDLLAPIIRINSELIRINSELIRNKTSGLLFWVPCRGSFANPAAQPNLCVFSLFIFKGHNKINLRI